MTIECVEKHIKFGFKAKKSQAAISQLLAIFFCAQNRTTKAKFNYSLILLYNA